MLDSDLTNPKKRVYLSLDEKKTILLECLEDNKAEDIIFIDLKNKSDITEYMIIATGLSKIHINSLAYKLTKKLKEAYYFSATIEGNKDSKWVLVDCDDILVHLFDKETRQYYQLEKMWLI